MEMNQALSAMLNERMHHFDSLPGASGSVIAAAAGRDLLDRSRNFALARLAALVLTVVVLWATVSLSNVVSSALALIHLSPGRDAILVTVLVAGFMAFWLGVWEHTVRIREARIAALTVAQGDALAAINTLRTSLPPACSMLDQNLHAVSARMLKIYPGSSVALITALSTLLLEALDSGAFRALTDEYAGCGAAATQLRFALIQVINQAGELTLLTAGQLDSVVSPHSGGISIAIAKRAR